MAWFHTGSRWCAIACFPSCGPHESPERAILVHAASETEKQTQTLTHSGSSVVDVGTLPSLFPQETDPRAHNRNCAKIVYRSTGGNRLTHPAREVSCIQPHGSHECNQ